MSKTFIITGGHSSNKGAQAMVFAVVQELRINHPDCKIWMVSENEENDDVYNFIVLTWHLRDYLRLVLGKLSFIFKPKSKEKEKRIRTLYKIADMVFDVSGYSLSSQFGFLSSIKYLLRIALAKKYDTELILLPQSFGPFDYNKITHKAILFPLMKRYLKYPNKIFSREKQGYEDIKRFTSNNIVKALDIVLLTKKPEREIIYKNNGLTNKTNFNPTDKSMAIIPNSKLLKWNKVNNIFALYQEMLETLTKNDYSVYILRHSREDLEFCQDIAALIEGNSKIKLLVDDYDCIELNEIISHMNFVIASRYHSLIHAYKSGVPALVIGWAEKYIEVMREFDQDKYCFDIRNKISEKEVEAVINDFKLNHAKYGELISRKVDMKRKQSIHLTQLFKGCSTEKSLISDYKLFDNGS